MAPAFGWSRLKKKSFPAEEAPVPLRRKG